jgi:hypothetical protein
LPLPPPGKAGWPWANGSIDVAADPSGQTGWPRISIVTPSFNQAQYLEETIRSVLLQGYPNLEHIVVDGGSTDGSVEIIRKYSPWLAHWVSEPDRGQAHAINKGFARCTGDLITFQNSDDYYLPGALTDAATRFMERRDAGAIVGAFMPLEGSEPGQPVSPRFPWDGAVDLREKPSADWRLHQVSSFFSRRVLDQVGRSLRADMHFALDRELLFRVLEQAPVALSDMCYAVFRLHPASKSVSVGLPFALEMASLYWVPEDGRVSRRRRRNWGAALAGGYLRRARTCGRRAASMADLARAARHDPRLALTIDYYKRWAKAVFYPGSGVAEVE